MRTETILLTAVLAGSQLFVAGCNTKSSSPEQVRQKTAEATSQLKEDAQAVAEGVREGLARPSADHPLNLNSASKNQLLSLPGITGDTADRIIAARPYTSTHELLEKHIISRDEFNKIADSISVEK
jgi:DNA uptake protein ComE-like DNA-binding protein